MEASYHPVPVRALGPCAPARIWDLSQGGVSLIVRRPFEPGTTLAVVPETLPLSLAPGLEARVVHVAPHGDGLWQVGCEFPVPLTEEELRLLLG
jgi:hypothetical protein